MTGIDFPITDLFARPSARSIASHLSPEPDASVTTQATTAPALPKQVLQDFNVPSPR